MSKPTHKQMALIQDIEEWTDVTFTGKTKDDAIRFIDQNRHICRHFYRLCEYADRLGNCAFETYRCAKGYDRKVYTNRTDKIADMRDEKE